MECGVVLLVENAFAALGYSLVVGRHLSVVGCWSLVVIRHSSFGFDSSFWFRHSGLPYWRSSAFIRGYPIPAISALVGNYCLIPRQD